MARIKQVGVGRKTSGTIDGITYVTRKGVTYARATPTMPISAYRTPAALRRQAVFKLIQMHLKYHLRTIRQTFTPKGNGTPTNRYYSVNSKALNLPSPTWPHAWWQARTSRSPMWRQLSAPMLQRILPASVSLP